MIDYTDISTDCEPVYMILGRLGQMYFEGKNGIEANYQEAGSLFTDAADKAIQFGNGRVANKYYVLADKAYSLVEQWEGKFSGVFEKYLFSQNKK